MEGLHYSTTTSHHLWDLLLKELICLLGPIRQAGVIKIIVVIAILPLSPESSLKMLFSIPLLINSFLSSHAEYFSFLKFSFQRPVLTSFGF